MGASAAADIKVEVGCLSIQTSQLSEQLTNPYVDTIPVNDDAAPASCGFGRLGPPPRGASSHHLQRLWRNGRRLSTESTERKATILSERQLLHCGGYVQVYGYQPSCHHRQDNIYYEGGFLHRQAHQARDGTALHAQMRKSRND